MKRIVLALSLMFIALAGTFAQADSTKNKPVLKFETTTYDFGTITQGSNGTFQLDFTNEGIEPLIVTNVQKGCGCTNTDWIKEPVKKGQKGWIKVTYNTQIVGAFSKAVTVFSNATNSSINVSFKGTVLAAAAAPASAVEKK